MKAPLETDLISYVTRRRTRHVHVGYVLLIASFLLFALFEFVDKGDRSYFALFVVHYAIAITYAGILMRDDAFGIHRSWRKDNIDRTVVLSQLLLVSAYALNRQITIFHDSTNWLCVYLLITSINALSFRYLHRLPVWVNRLQYFILGSAIVFYLYMTLYVAQYFIVGTLGMIVFGLGGHIFVPALLLTVLISLVIHNKRKTDTIRWAVGGVVCTVLGVSTFVYTWHSRIDAIERIANQSVLETNRDLPAWVEIAQQLKVDWITERILKTGLVYKTAHQHDDWLPRTIPWEEEEKHDPLVYISTLKSRTLLTNEDQVKILRAITDQRHRSNERLWSGDNLTTSYIVSDVDLYPELRMSYTEKYLTIRNNDASNRWWGDTEEAIYTFELPEGSVITSLSLWIGGVEEKAIMTSKQNAATAYNTIVGRERRDPSVVHWQEGNTVTVRVFPCTNEEERKFKIGITSPLEQHDGKIIYRNVKFLGPNANGANETIRLRTPGKQMERPGGDFRPAKNEFYMREAKYDADFELELPAVPLKDDNRFVFQGSVYSLAEYEPTYEKTSFDKIYLDVNNSWTAKDLSTIEKWITHRSVYIISEEGPVQLTPYNLSSVLEQKTWNFSLFPFHELKDLDHTLIITKGRTMSPHLSDFKESEFAKGMTRFFTADQKVHVYNLGHQSSTYINSLRELRSFHYAQGSIDQLDQWLKEGIYPVNDESERRVVLHQSNMVISKKPATEGLKSNAPDHLARLFAYNNILRQVGSTYFDDKFVNESLVHEATTAYVVSPVSSLIVLETANDYERFNIHDNAESLKNASKESSGAVPEPHEWALILLAAMFAIFVVFKKTHG
jgi:XrtN system VIT domain protein